jgi:DNA-binding NtrC family response regulator
VSKEYKDLSLHRKMEVLVEELVDRDLPLKSGLREFEKLFILAAARRFKGNKTRMAEGLGIHRNTLHNLCKSLEID